MPQRGGHAAPSPDLTRYKVREIERSVLQRVLCNLRILKGYLMANAHGHLPKANPQQLTPALQHQLAVWRDKAYTDDNLFLRGYPETFSRYCIEIKQHPAGNETSGDRRDRAC
jgi:hypothetical protein